MNFDISEIAEKLEGAAALCKECAGSFAEKTDIKGKKDKVTGFLSKKINLKLDISVDVGVLIAIGAALLVIILMLIGARRKK